MNHEKKASRESDKLAAMLAMGIAQDSLNKIKQLHVGVELSDYSDLLAKAGRKYKPLLAKLSQRNTDLDSTQKDLDYLKLVAKKMEGALYYQVATQMFQKPGSTNINTALQFGTSMSAITEQYRQLWNTNDLTLASKLLSYIKDHTQKMLEISKTIKGCKPEPEDILGNLAWEIKQKRLGS